METVLCKSLLVISGTKSSFAVSLEELDLMISSFLHRGDAGWLNYIRLSQALILQDLTHFLIIGNLNVAGNIDLIHAQGHRLADFSIGVVGAAMENQRNRHLALDYFQQVQLQFRLHALRYRERCRWQSPGCPRR